MNSFANKISIVTGGTGGIGAAIVHALQQQGSRVVIFDINESALSEAKRAFGSNQVDVHTKRVDVTDYDDVARAIAEVEAELGGLHYLVNVVGGRGRTKGSSISKTSADDWAHVIDLNLGSAFNCIKAGADAIRRQGGGAIVNIGSLAGLTMPASNSASYTAAKAGILGLTRHSAYELARDNIRVNAVLPGPVLTPQLEARATPEMLNSVANTLPLGRWLTPEEVAAPVMFLLSDGAAACIGTYIVVDGGLHIGNPTTPAEYFRIRGEE